MTKLEVMEDMTVKLSSSAIALKFVGSEEALAETVGFCTLCLTDLVSPWENVPVQILPHFDCQKGVSPARLTLLCLVLAV
jgi:hypothetical protein